MKSERFIPEFRYNKRRKHYSYIFKKEGDYRKNLLLSTKPERKKKKKGKTKTIKNVSLYKHPNPNKPEEKQYIITKIYKDDKSNFSNRRLSDWQFHSYDKRKIKKIKHKKWK